MNKYVVGDVVVHCREGVSIITGETIMSGNEYFTVTARDGNGDTIFVPKANASLLIRPILDEVTARAIIEEMKTIETESFNNTKQRRDNYHKRIASGNPRDLAFLTKQLMIFNEVNKDGIVMKLGPSDLMVLESAKKMFFKELALTFNVGVEEVAKLFE